jgi:predicted nucleic-acid-binding Zn-ribbon protein
MATEKKCLRCGGASLEPGAIRSTGHIYFRPENAKFFTFQFADVPVRANMCVDCGTIELVGDVRKAQSLTGKPKPV